MKTLSIKTYLAILAIGITGAIVIILLFIVYPTVRDIQKIGLDITAKSEELASQRERALDPERSLKELDDVEKRVAGLAEATVDRGEELNLIRQFETLAERHHISQTLKLSELNETGYRFSFTNKAAFIDHMAYLYSLQTLPFYVVIPSIAWSKDRNEDKITMKFDATIYASVP